MSVINIQPAEKRNLEPSGILEVHSVFKTIQGEGPFTGHRAIFVRLAGCNLQCPGCDTEYTQGRRMVEVDALVTEVSELAGPGHLVVITGGEPFRQNIVPFVEALLVYGFKVQIETNGTLFLRLLPYDLITVVCSPKTGSIHKELKPHLAALKYVVKADDIDQEDGLPIHALDHPTDRKVARPRDTFKGAVYIQPMDEQDPEKNQANMNAAIASAMGFGYILCIQTHKITNLP